MPDLTDEQCDEFRRMPRSFRDIVRAIYAAGLAAAPPQTAEPVAWRYRVSMRGHERNQWQYTNGPQRPLPPASADDRHRIIEVEPLYTSPRITAAQIEELVAALREARPHVDTHPTTKEALHAEWNLLDRIDALLTKYTEKP